VIVRDLIANHTHNIGHRRLVQGEVWCRMQFRDQQDEAAFMRTLGWTAFRAVEPAPPQTPQTETPAAGPKSKR
jgi:hypothetical protein